MPTSLALALVVIVALFGIKPLVLGVLGLLRGATPATPTPAHAYPLAPRSPNVARALDNAERALAVLLFEPEIQMRLGMTPSEAKDLAFTRDRIIAWRARA